MSMGIKDRKLVDKLNLYGLSAIATRYERDSAIRETVRRAFKHRPNVYTINPFGISVDTGKISEAAKKNDSHYTAICEVAFREEELTRLLFRMQVIGSGATNMEIWNSLIGMKYEDIRDALPVLGYRRGFDSEQLRYRCKAKDIPFLLRRYSSRPEWYDQPPINTFSIVGEGLDGWYRKNPLAGRVMEFCIKHWCKATFNGSDVTLLIPDANSAGKEMKYGEDRKILLMDNNNMRMLTNSGCEIIEPLDAIRETYENLQKHIDKFYRELNSTVLNIRGTVPFNERRVKNVLADTLSHMRKRAR